MYEQNKDADQLCNKVPLFSPMHIVCFLMWRLIFVEISILIIGGPQGRVVKVADFSAPDHSIISPMWVRASLGARVTCGTSQVLLAGVSGGFFPGTPVFAPPTD